MQKSQVNISQNFVLELLKVIEVYDSCFSLEAILSQTVKITANILAFKCKIKDRLVALAIQHTSLAKISTEVYVSSCICQRQRQDLCITLGMNGDLQCFIQQT